MSDMSTARARPGAGAELAADIEAQGDRRARSKNVRPLMRLLPLVGAHRRELGLATLFLLISTAASLSLTAALRLVVDRGFNLGAADLLDRYFVFAGLIVVLLAGATALRYFFVTQLGERTVADLRALLYRHIVMLDPAFFLRVRTGEVLSRLTTDITLVENLLASSASVALRNFLLMIGAVSVLIATSPGLTLGVVILVPLVLGPLFILGRRVRRRSAETQERFAQAVGYAGETLDALDTVQAFGREREAGARFAQAVDLAFEASVKRIRERATMTFVVMALVFGGVGAILYLGAHSVSAGTMSPGTLVQFVALAAMAAAAVGALGEVWGDIQKASGAMERICEILDARPAIEAPAMPAILPSPPRGEIALEEVSFAYPGREDTLALDRFSLTVRPGERVALVGPSGAGKSTVFRLVLRFYDPQGGRVVMDGIDLRQADPAQARARIALVAQDSPLFSGTACENIRFGAEAASVEDARRAADQAQAGGFIRALPQGFDTPLGERGKTLSGGQRQRLAIARALVRQAPILLLDEATSALDAENERLVQEVLHEAMAGHTCLIIAHRLSTVLKADRIVVMDDGRAVEEGTHAELLARGGLYARLARLQFASETV